MIDPFQAANRPGVPHRPTRLERKYARLKAEVARYKAQVEAYSDKSIAGAMFGDKLKVPTLTLNSLAIAQGKLAAFESHHPEFQIGDMK